ncbi:mandelate racemase/muconate lactonizing enzyme family protein [Natrarchaeobaculum aegyptiacum]|uniref:Mandelate racemase/muconate lactonizing enzyme C-terminal domain-containing protein n=1 Tax=Natrarchaeobaculum aegyptiacum TaxID=745377 RepID=A0A2Z2HTS7_9EURY|nr:dipeptide epimerase [Natrarchaeobaculum aegyptiacum]ARS90203.1 hypothetical protein B1756_11025 [Natrarchaeobaculum aegyptiacum]
MRVERVTPIPISVPVEQALKTSKSADGDDEYHRILIVLETDTGVTGYGEIAPMAHWPRGLTQSACLDLLEDVLVPAVDETRVHRIPRLVEDLSSRLADEPFPLYGLEVALHDALARERELPMYEHLGGPVGGDPELECHYTVSIDEPSRVAEEARTAAADGYEAFKVKVGGDDFAAERENVRTIRETVPDARIRVDVNGAWSPDEAIRKIRRLDDDAGGLAFVEQPVSRDVVDGHARVRDRVPVPILADEACFSASDVARLATRGSADIVNLKLAKTGGFTGAKAAATVAAAHGVSCFVGGMLELGIGQAASAHFAVSTPEVAYPTGIFNVDVGDSLLANDDEWRIADATCTVPSSPGLGVELDSEALERCRTD